MKSIFITVFIASLSSLAATKVVEKQRVVDQKTVSANGCSITGEYTNSIYNAGEFKYTVTMKIKIKQTMESYKVAVNKNLFGKVSESPVNNSTKPAADKYVESTQSITRVVRADSPSRREELLKACEAEMLFINTGAYPPPPPKPPEPPKKETKPVVPVVPNPTPDPIILPDPLVPPVDSGTVTPDAGTNPLFPIDIPGLAPEKKEEKKDPKKN